MEWLILSFFALGAILVYRHYDAKGRAGPSPVAGRKPGSRRRGPVGRRPPVVEIQLDRLPGGVSPPASSDSSMHPVIVRAGNASSYASLGGDIPRKAALAERGAARRSLGDWCTATGLTVDDLASRSGIELKVVRQIENGTRTPSGAQAQALANHLGVHLDDVRFPERSAFGSNGRTLSGLHAKSITETPEPVARMATSTGAANPKVSAYDALVTADKALRPVPRLDPSRTYPISDARRQVELTIPQLGIVTGLPAWRIEQIENGTRSPTVEDVGTLARALGTLPDKLSFRSPPAQKPQGLGVRVAKLTQIIRPSEEPFRWVRPDEVVQVSGHSIPGGMFFLGQGMRSPQGPRPARCLIDPSLKVAGANADVSGMGAPYWPSYSDIGPTSRLAFLRWMAGGRRDPDYAISYVFIFLYGLERRLVLDRVHGETAQIATELRRLMEIYGTNYSFRSYATKLLGVAAALSDDVDLPGPALKSGYEEELPLAVRLRVGKTIAGGHPLHADDALTWLLAHPETYVRTPVERCFAEARLLWTTKFVERYPRGLKLSAPKRTIRVRYQAASSEFETEILPTFAGAPIPDVVALSAPLGWMREALAASSDELQAYSRLLGRKPEARGTLEAALLLPRELEHTEHGSAVSAARLSLGVEAAGSVGMTLRDVLSSISMVEPEGGKVTASLIGQVGSSLDRLDFGFEPDRRYGPGMPDLETPIVLFEAPGGCRVDGSREPYRAMRTMIEVAALAAAVDERKDGLELAAIEADVESATELQADERKRLRAFARFAMTATARKGNVLSRLSKMAISERRQMARGAMAVVLADGHASASEIRFLEKLYKTMKLPVDELYSAVHRGGVEIDEPVSIMAEVAVAGVTIPRPPEAGPASSSNAALTLDRARLDRIRSETSAVSQLLADIFEEEEAPDTVPRTAHGSTDGLAGLDAAHSGLLRSVQGRQFLDDAEFATLARKFGLLPGGALETINEWSFECFDGPILEETGEGVEFVSDLVHALQGGTEAA